MRRILTVAAIAAAAALTVPVGTALAASTKNVTTCDVEDSAAWNGVAPLAEAGTVTSEAEGVKKVSERCTEATRTKTRGDVVVKEELKEKEKYNVKFDDGSSVKYKYDCKIKVTTKPKRDKLTGDVTLFYAFKFEAKLKWEVREADGTREREKVRTRESAKDLTEADLATALAAAQATDDGALDCDFDWEFETEVLAPLPT